MTSLFTSPSLSPRNNVHHPLGETSQGPRGETGRAAPTSWPRIPAAVWGSCPRKTNPRPRQHSPALLPAPGQARRPAGRQSAAPTRTRLTGGTAKHGPHPAPRPGNPGPQSRTARRGAAPRPCSPAADSPALTLSSRGHSLPCLCLRGRERQQDAAPRATSSRSLAPVQRQEVVLLLKRSPRNTLTPPRGSGAAQEVAALCWGFR